MAVENFTTYTEVDASSHLTVTTSKALGENVGRDEDVYLYKDFGVDAFNALSVTFELYIASTSMPQTGYVAPGAMGFANVVNDISGFGVTDISVVIGREVSTFKIWLERGPGTASDVYTGAADTIYYCLLERATDSDTATLKIYSDATRVTLLDTLTISGVGTSTKWRYCYGFVNWDASKAGVEFDGYVQNLNLSATIGNTAPSITTQAVTDIDKTTATGNGNVISLGVPTATQHGHCWATFYNLYLANASYTEKGVPSATGAFTSSLTGLVQNTKYYIRAYITSSVGTRYGASVEFTTLGSTPVVTTDLVTGVAVTTALGNGSIDNNGGSAITEHGVCWGASANPTTADDKTEEGATSVIGDFSSLMTGLTAETAYHVRAYATNGTGTGYGTDKTFTTHAVGSPIVTTQTSTNVQSASATGNGTIVDIGGASVTQHGHCWSTLANPTTALSTKTENGVGSVASFTSTITDLTAGTAYYIRAYATNSFGTSYGDNDIINEVAGELKGNYAVLGEWWVYTDKFGNRRALLGDRY